MDGLRLAKVVRFVPEAHAADLLFLDDGSRVPMVQVLSGSASTNTGVSDMAQPDAPPQGDEWSPAMSGTRDVIAAVAYFRNVPLVIGFLFPQVAQCLFADKNRKVTRHASDVYTTVDDDGNVEVYHPSGTYLRIATDPAHEDLTGQDFDAKWKIARNTDKAVHVRLRLSNAGEQKGLVEIDPDGNANIDLKGNLSGNVAGNSSHTVGGSASVNATGDINLTAGGNITITATGNVDINGTRIDLN